METGVKEKFAQNPKLQQNLLATRGKVIGEATKKNIMWGIGLNLHDKAALDLTKWKGYNMLGKILGKIRDSQYALMLLKPMYRLKLLPPPPPILAF